MVAGVAFNLSVVGAAVKVEHTGVKSWAVSVARQAVASTVFVVLGDQLIEGVVGLVQSLSGLNDQVEEVDAVVSVSAICPVGLHLFNGLLRDQLKGRVSQVCRFFVLDLGKKLLTWWIS